MCLVYFDPVPLTINIYDELKRIFDNFLFLGAFYIKLFNIIFLLKMETESCFEKLLDHSSLSKAQCSNHHLESFRSLYLHSSINFLDIIAGTLESHSCFRSFTSEKSKITIDIIK